MSFQKKENIIEWKVHFKSPIEKVFEFLNTDKGRSKFWAEETKEEADFIEFKILNYPPYKAQIIEKISNKRLRLDYFGTDVTFDLTQSDYLGTDLYLKAITPNQETKFEMTAGWVSVLMAMKAAVDFGIELRKHNSERSWENGYLDN